MDFMTCPTLESLLFDEVVMRQPVTLMNFVPTSNVAGFFTGKIFGLCGSTPFFMLSRWLTLSGLISSPAASMLLFLSTFLSSLLRGWLPEEDTCIILKAALCCVLEIR